MLMAFRLADDRDINLIYGFPLQHQRPPEGIHRKGKHHGAENRVIRRPAHDLYLAAVIGGRLGSENIAEGIVALAVVKAFLAYHGLLVYDKGGKSARVKAVGAVKLLPAEPVRAVRPFNALSGKAVRLPHQHILAAGKIFLLPHLFKRGKAYRLAENIVAVYGTLVGHRLLIVYKAQSRYYIAGGAACIAVQLQKRARGHGKILPRSVHGRIALRRRRSHDALPSRCRLIARGREYPPCSQKQKHHSQQKRASGNDPFSETPPVLFLPGSRICRIPIHLKTALPFDVP